jgi:hypothetical protein
LRHVPAPDQLGGALGATTIENGKVLGQVEVFCDSVRRMLRARWPPAPALEGWALSTVAVHELYHYLNNEHDHHNGRLNQEVMTPEGLVQGWSYDVMTASSDEEALALHGITPRGSTF